MSKRAIRRPSLLPEKPKTGQNHKTFVRIQDKIRSSALLCMLPLAAACMKKTVTATEEQSSALNVAPSQKMAELIDSALTRLNELPSEIEIQNQTSGELNFAQTPKLNAQAQRNVRDLLSRVNTMWRTMGRNPCSVWTPIERKLGK